MTTLGLGSGDGPDEDSDESWTNELLPLGIRRELLARELQKYIASKRHAQSATPKQDSTSEHRRSSEHPRAGHATDRRRNA